MLQDVSEMDEDSDVEEQDQMDHTGSRFVMKEANKFRKAPWPTVTILRIFVAPRGSSSPCEPMACAGLDWDRDGTSDVHRNMVPFPAHLH